MCTQPKKVSKKEIKKLSSRQDIVDVWVEKWAKWQWQDIQEVKFSVLGGAFLIYKKKRKFINISLHEILYSLDSNFFSVVFPDLSDVDYGVGRDWLTTTPEDYKRDCVASNDPLTFLLTELNETLGF